MREYITIRNVGPLKNIERLEVRPLTVLIGESAIGKSTLMKVLILMRYIFKRANIRSFLKHSNITRAPFHILFNSLTSSTNLSSLFKRGAYIDYEVEMGQGRSYHLTYEMGKKLSLPNINKEDLTFGKESFISENRNIIPSWTANVLTNKNASLGFYFHETMNDFGQAIKDDCTYSLSHLGLNLTIEHPKGRPVKMTVEPLDKSYSAVNLVEASSGVQTSASLSVIVQHFANAYSFKDAFRRSVLDYLFDSEQLTKFSPVIELSDIPKYVHIHIEEPELSLFPDAQCYLIDDIVRIALQPHTDDRKIGLIMATHSPYILNYLNVILHQQAEGRAHVDASEMAVYRIFDGKAQSLLVTDEDGKAMVDTYDLTEMMSSIYSEYTELSK